MKLAVLLIFWIYHLISFNIFLYNIEGEIRVRSCLPDDYTEVLPLCTENDGTCHGTLNITVIPFVSIRFIKFYDPIYISQYDSFLSLFNHMTSRLGV